MRPLVGVAVVLALLVGADRAGDLVAGRVLAERVAARTDGLAADPQADVRGVPFLTQLVGGTYDDVRIRADLLAGPVPVRELEVRLRGLELGLERLVSGDVGEVPVQGLTATGLLLWDDLEAVADRPVELSLQGPGQIRVNGEADVQGRRVVVDAVSTAQVVDGAIQVTASRLMDGDGQPVPGDQGLLDVRLPSPDLPYGLVLEQVRPSAQGLVVTARGGPTVLR